MGEESASGKGREETRQLLSCTRSLQTQDSPSASCTVLLKCRHWLFLLRRRRDRLQPRLSLLVAGESLSSMIPPYPEPCKGVISAGSWRMCLHRGLRASVDSLGTLGHSLAWTHLTTLGGDPGGRGIGRGISPFGMRWKAKPCRPGRVPSPRSSPRTTVSLQFRNRRGEDGRGEREAEGKRLGSYFLAQGASKTKTLPALHAQSCSSAAIGSFCCAEGATDYSLG